MKILSILILFFLGACNSKQQGVVVFQSDFGLKNNAVASMLGVAVQENPNLNLYTLTHDIPSYDIWSAALMLSGTIEYWPKGTVFVSVVDPGVGTDRRSVVAKTKTGHYIVTPDNGTLTFIAEQYGIEELREIDEAVNRRKNTDKSYTFHGRDVYAYTGAKLASGSITFDKVGRQLPPTPVLLSYTPAQKIADNTFEGTIELVDEPYGNVWSNIDRELFLSEGIKIGDMISVSIWNNNTKIYSADMPYVDTFGEVDTDQALLYVNSLYNVSLALNMNDFARSYNINYGEGWEIQISKKS